MAEFMKNPSEPCMKLGRPRPIKDSCNFQSDRPTDGLLPNFVRDPLTSFDGLAAIDRSAARAYARVASAASGLCCPLGLRLVCCAAVVVRAAMRALRCAATMRAAHWLLYYVKIILEISRDIATCSPKTWRYARNYFIYNDAAEVALPVGTCDVFGNYGARLAAVSAHLLRQHVQHKASSMCTAWLLISHHLSMRCEKRGTRKQSSSGRL
eukprot:1574975-Pleurochrysis_carterae.AAC.6